MQWKNKARLGINPISKGYRKRKHCLTKKIPSYFYAKSLVIASTFQSTPSGIYLKSYFSRNLEFQKKICGHQITINFESSGNLKFLWQLLLEVSLATCSGRLRPG
jgi:hypothetical protein